MRYVLSISVHTPCFLSPLSLYFLHQCSFGVKMSDHNNPYSSPSLLNNPNYRPYTDPTATDVDLDKYPEPKDSTAKVFLFFLYFSLVSLAISFGSSLKCFSIPRAMRAINNKLIKCKLNRSAARTSCCPRW